MYRKFGKRLFDVAASFVGVIVLSPVFACASLAVWLSLGRPVLFRQSRPGLNQEPFEILKFRTMRDAVDERGVPLRDRDRLVPMGAFLRMTSVDELPALWNVLAGEMSLVGPRPLLPRYTEYLTEQECRRFAVRPGITGLAQVRGRNDLCWDDRLASDVEYVGRVSFLFDLAILLRTAWCVAVSRGFRSDPESIMCDLDEERSGRNSPSRIQEPSH